MNETARQWNLKDFHKKQSVKLRRKIESLRRKLQINDRVLAIMETFDRPHSIEELWALLDPTDTDGQGTLVGDRAPESCETNSPDGETNAQDPETPHPDGETIIRFLERVGECVTISEIADGTGLTRAFVAAWINSVAGENTLESPVSPRKGEWSYRLRASFCEDRQRSREVVAGKGVTPEVIVYSPGDDRI